MEPDFEAAAAVLRDAPGVAIACHVNPDADALGSMLGLAHHLVARGTRVICASRPMSGRAPPRMRRQVSTTSERRKGLEMNAATECRRAIS